MCDKNRYHLDALNCDYVIENPGKGEFVVKGRLQKGGKQKIVYYAANPATYNGSFTGSGLPFPNPEVAFENTPNNGTVYTSANGEFEFRVFYPNSYYVGLGTIYVSPHVFIKTCDSEDVHSIYLGDGIPFRMLTYPSPPFTAPRRCPMFYAEGGRQMPPRSQEQILRDSAYPETNKMPANFWGKAIQHS
jgi:hypothetical protein